MSPQLPSQLIFGLNKVRFYPHCICYLGYLDDLCRLCMGERSRFIVVYADDIMLISPSVVEIERFTCL